MQGQHAVHHGVLGKGQAWGVDFGPVQPVKRNCPPVEKPPKQEDPQRIQAAQPAPAQPGEVFLGFAVKDGSQQMLEEVDRFLYGVNGIPPERMSCINRGQTTSGMVNDNGKFLLLRPHRGREFAPLRLRFSRRKTNASLPQISRGGEGISVLCFPLFNHDSKYAMIH